MKFRSIILCPFLKGSSQGVHCSACDKLVKDIPGGNTRLCMSSHYEMCSVHVSLLYQENGSDCHPSYRVPGELI